MRRSSRSPASSSRWGAMMRQGPHQGAQKSTSVGLSDSSTSAWKLLSVTSASCAMNRLLREVDPPLYKVKRAASGSDARSGLLGEGEPAQQVRRPVDLDERRGDQNGHG